MYEINLTNNQYLLQVNEELLHQTVAGTLSAEDVASAEIVLALVDDNAIHKVNQTHLSHDYPTDVISFLYSSDELTLESVNSDQLRGADRHIDGEVVVSTETAMRKAEEFGWNPVDELRLYIVHGLLHLCGYDDLSDSEEKIMRRREREVLATWNLTPHYQ